MPRLFHTGIGEEPFEFEYDGRAFTVHPPDARWEKVEEEYTPASTLRSNFPSYIRDKWVKTDGKPRPNHLDIDADQAQFLRLGKYVNIMRKKGVVFEHDLKGKLAQQIDAKMAEHMKRLEEIETMSLDEVKAARRKPGRPKRTEATAE